MSEPERADLLRVDADPAEAWRLPPEVLGLDPEGSWRCAREQAYEVARAELERVADYWRRVVLGF